ncbi:IS3 family transposase [Roseburia sp. 1XD42-34]|nr:IS3 family transposase [Roseburia sp. 1XD42-34]RKI75321.1 IS3 family transposase [Clostridium sp. 1xD42-85]
MIQMSLRSHIFRSNGYSTKTSYIHMEEKILNREFTAEKPNEKWITDITQMVYGFGNKAYFSAIKGLYDSSIVAYQVGRYNDNPLVMNTLKEAIEANPDATPLIHSDRGSQYTSKEYLYLTTEAGMKCSMSRVGNCIDNEPIESFFGHFKCESYDLKNYKNFEELEKDIDKYITFYNEER